MKDPIIIDRSELDEIVNKSINATLTALGIKRKPFKPWMSKNAASKLAGRRMVERAIKDKRIECTVNLDNGRYYLSREDVQKLLNNPKI